MNLYFYSKFDFVTVIVTANMNLVTPTCTSETETRRKLCNNRILNTVETRCR